jgi:hypothetical protein
LRIGWLKNWSLTSLSPDFWAVSGPVEAQGSDLQPCPWPNDLLEVITQQAADVVDQFHRASLTLA